MIARRPFALSPPGYSVDPKVIESLRAERTRLVSGIDTRPQLSVLLPAEPVVLALETDED